MAGNNAIEPIGPRPDLEFQYGMMTHRHRKRGSFYRKLGVAELQSEVPITEGTPLVIYVGEDGKLWARPESEFEDGRFEKLK